MQLKTWILLIAGALTAGIYTIISSLISDTEAIWLLTRLFGLVSFLTLFIVLLLGEVRLLAKDKSKVTLFRYHKPLAIFAAFLVFLHFISAVADNYKWGRGLHVWQYLGFTFSNSWLVLLSLGTLAFYLMLLIGLTSATKSIQFLGFKRWKLIHYLSYAAFAIAYVHAVNLGTDIKHSALAPVLKPTVMLMFAFATAFFVVRVINSFPVFLDQWEVNLAAALVLLLLVFGALTAAAAVQIQESVQEAKDKAAALDITITAQEQNIDALQQNIANLTQRLGALHG
jgi:DMSO/TMAO reductase YedYZ heme-binding membrane subunit